MIRSGLRALGEMLALTRDLKNLRVLVLSGVIGTLGAGLLNPVLPVYLESRGLGLERIGLVYTVGSLLPVFLQPALGALSDRVSRKRILFATSLATSLLIPLFVVIEDPLWLAAALSARLMLDRSATPISAAMIGDFAPSTKRATVFGLLSSAVNLVFVAALFASAAALGLFGERGVFWIGGALFLGSSAVLLALDETGGERPAGGGERPGLKVALRGLYSPIDILRKQPEYIALFAYQLCFTFALDLFPIYLPLHAVKLGAKPAHVGPLIALSWLVYALVQPAGGRLSDRLARRRGLIAWGLAGMAACAAIIGASGRLSPPFALPVMAAAWTIMAVPDGLFRPASDALLVDVAPAEGRGRFIGALGSAAAMANVLAPLVYGLVAARAGVGGAFIASAGAFLAALFCIRYVKEPAAAPLTAAPPEIS